LYHADQQFKEVEKMARRVAGRSGKNRRKGRNKTRCIKLETRRLPRPPMDPSATYEASLVIFTPSALVIRRKKGGSKEESPYGMIIGVDVLCNIGLIVDTDNKCLR
jgi:hypothetical protein